jgi:hypothetical protein
MQSSLVSGELLASGCNGAYVGVKNQQAVLLSQRDLSLEDKKIGRLLSFFGVPWRILRVGEFLADSTTRRSTAPNSRIFCSAEILLQLLEDLERDQECVQSWTGLHSAFVYAGHDSEILQKLVRRLTGDDRSSLRKSNGVVGDVAVSGHLDEFCGVMAGVRTTISKSIGGADFVLNVSEGNATSIISGVHGAAFLKVEYKGVTIFLSTSREIIDIDAELASQNFDVREHFLSAVPVVLYIKWAFAETCWSAPETNACLIIDDPVLKGRHGFVNFQELLSLMKRHKFSSNIAFIPWNWRRSSPETTRLFRENPENYSVSVHGCDHTRAEFGSFDRQRLYWKAQQALERMNRHETITGIRHDRVMVFPQGIFSEAAISALKHTDLIAAVNNDLISTDPHRRAVILSELWDVAVMGYSNFPIFTRRYPWEGIENFAFDALLGKPAIIVIHHDYCSDHCSRLINFIERLNALKYAPTWRSLGETVGRSCRQKVLASGEVEIEMYATQLRVENRFEQSKRFLFRRRECEPSAIREICDGSGPIAWNSVNGHINFEMDLSSGESKIVSIKFHELAGNGYNEDNLPYRFKAMLRRYLCEVRDNYVTTMKSRLTGFVSR